MKPLIAAWICLLLSGVTGTAIEAGKMVTVRLRDGTTVAGTVRSDDAAQITVVTEYASGTISQTLAISRTNVVEVAVWSPEQVAAWQMNRAYQDLQRYRLNPSTSYPLTYYDQVIAGAFRPFLARYPNSPWEKDLLDRVAQWETERQQVASGNVKVRGQWISPDAQRVGTPPGRGAPAPPPVTEEESSVLSAIAAWSAKYWPLVLGVVAVGLWLLSRAFGR